jgi:hypothetical protein
MKTIADEVSQATQAPQARRYVFWGTTALFAVPMAASGVMGALLTPHMVASMQSLGYPNHLLHILALAKFLGLPVLFAGNRYPRLREWAYAGFTFELLGAAVSLVISGQNPAMPLVFLGLLGASYRARPETS